MITVYVLILSVSLFLLIATIDVILYGRSYWDIMLFIFDMDFGTQEYYVIGGYIIGLLFAVGMDVRQKQRH